MKKIDFKKSSLGSFGFSIFVVLILVSSFLMGNSSYLYKFVGSCIFLGITIFVKIFVDLSNFLKGLFKIDYIIAFFVFVTLMYGYFCFFK